MALSNVVFTAPSAPNLAGLGLQVVANRPDPYGAFSKGYDDQQKREMALQQYREAKLKADLAATLYPKQSELQLALINARLNAINSPNNYQVQPSPIQPISTAPVAVPVGNGNGGTVAVRPPPINPVAVDPRAEEFSSNDFQVNPFAGNVTLFGQ